MQILKFKMLTDQRNILEDKSMRRNCLKIISIVIAILALSLGCQSNSNGGTVISVTCDEMQGGANITKNQNISVGDVITVNLCSNRTTGFTWEGTEKNTSPDIVAQTSYKWISPEESGKVGVAGKEVWIFKGLKPGNSTISMEYSQPWAGGTKAGSTFTLNLTVK
jgi:inhibitor of cysteine peptidase